MTHPIGCVLMAAGASTRFGQNKLFVTFQGAPLITAALSLFAQHPHTVVVTRYEVVGILAEQAGFEVVLREKQGDVADTIGDGLTRVCDTWPDVVGCLFGVCDQPRLRLDSVQRLMTAFLAEPQCIHALAWGTRRGNPVIFPKSLFEDLLHLPPGASGGHVIQTNKALLRLTQVQEPVELTDTDTLSALESLKN